MPSNSIMFIAGDPSGDCHTAGVIRRLRAELPDVSLWGIGGPAMEKQGFQPVMPFAPFNRMGFVEVAAHIGFFLNAKKNLIRLLDKRMPDAVVCVDYPGFNMPFMKAAARRGVPVLWYIAPMVWVWKANRAAVLGRYASHIAVIFPFETSWFSSFRAPVSFVGNPTVEELEQAGVLGRPVRQHPGYGGFRLAIIPGSRRQEIQHLLPRMIGAFSILRQRFPGLNLRATVSRYGALPMELFRDIIGGAPVELSDRPLPELLAESDVAMVTSGTATLETALMGVPQVIVYHTSAITYAIARRLVRIPHIGLPNIVAGKEIVPECIQEKAEPAHLAHILEQFIESPMFYSRTVERLVALRNDLGEKKPSVEVCAILKELLMKNSI